MRWEGPRKELTLRHRLGIRQVRIGVIEVAPKARVGDQAGRHGQDVALAAELAPPPVRGEQISKFGL